MATEFETVILPDGKPARVPVEHVDRFVNETGAKRLTVDESIDVAREGREEQRLEEEYGDSPIKAGWMGLVRGASLGLSDLAAREAGGENLEIAQQLRERNETASMVGEIAGATVPSLITGGAATPAGLAGRAGTSLIAKGAERGLATRALFSAAGGAVEGGLQGAGAALSELSLSDEELSAENLVRSLGQGALMGAGLGGAIGGGAPLLGAASKETFDLGKRLIGEGADSIPGLARKALGVDDLLPPPRIARRTVEETKRTLSSTWNDMDVYSRSLLVDADDILKNEAEYFGTAVDRISGKEFVRHGPDLDGVRELTKRVTDDRKALSEAVYQTDKQIVRGQARHGGDLVFTPEFVANMSDDQLKAVGRYWNSTQQLKQKIESFVPEGTGMGRPTTVQLSEMTQKAFERLAPKVTGEADKVAKKYGNVIADLAGVASFGGDENIPLVGNIPGVGEFLKLRMMLRQGIRGAKLIGILPGLAAKANGAAQKTSVLVEKIAGGTARTASRVTAGAKKAAIPLGTSAILRNTQIAPESRPQKNETPQTSYKRLSAEVDAFPSDPAKVEERIARNLPEAAAKMPGLVDQMARTASRKVEAIRKALPRDPRPLSMGSRWQPTKRQLEDLAKVIKVLDDPDELLSAIIGNRATRSMADAVREVYPRWFAGIQSDLMDQISERAADMPYRRRLQLSDVLGVALDPSRDPEYVRIVQAGYQQPNQPQGPQGGPNPSPKIDLSSMHSDGARSGRRIV